MKHKHWIFVAYDEVKNDNFIMPVEATVNDAQNEEEALNEVKKIVVRKFYTLRKVYECTQCFYQDETKRILAKMIQ